MTRPSHPFQTAFRAILLAIGIPAVIIMFGAIRSRQLQSTANPRWAKFAEAAGQKIARESREDDARRLPVQTVSIQNEEQSSTTRISDQSEKASELSSQLVMQYSGSVTGSASIDAAARSKAYSLEESGEISNDDQHDHRERPPIIFRPVDEENDDSKIELMIAGFQSQLTAVCQRLDRMTMRMQDDLLEQTALESRLFDVLTHLNERASQTIALPETIQSSKADVEFSVEHRRTAVQETAEERGDAKEIASASKLLASDASSKMLSETNLTAAGDKTAAMIAELEAQKIQLQTEKNRIQLEAEKERIELQAEKNRIETQAGKNRIEAEQNQLEAAKNQFHQEKKEFEAEQSRITSEKNQHAIAVRSSDWIEITRAATSTSKPTFNVDVRDADIRLVFAKFSNTAKVSIVSSPEVQGRVSLSLHAANFDTAMKAILKSRDYEFEREGNILIVKTAEEVARNKPQGQQTIMKIYRPHYVSAAELGRLIEPVLSSAGRHSLTSPSRTAFSRADELHREEMEEQGDTIVVQDMPDVLDRIDQILVDIDVPPLQVNIEAKILSVRLSNGIERGIDLCQFPCHRDVGASYAEGGLKHASLSCNVPTFIKSIERLADTSVVASQRIQVLNKRRAEMLIGDRIGYQSTAGGEVQFMEAGTRLVLRPSISADGFIRMEIRPERSSVTYSRRTNLPQQNTAELTTEVMIRDGATVAIAGLISEQATETTKRMPGMGTIPLISNPFRYRKERQQRTELIVLVTPHIVVDCEAQAEGECLEQITEQRANEFRDGQSSHSRHNLARAHFERAACYLKQGDYVKARQQVDASLRQNKADLEAIRLRNEINQCLSQQAE